MTRICWGEYMAKKWRTVYIRKIEQSCSWLQGRAEPVIFLRMFADVIVYIFAHSATWSSISQKRRRSGQKPNELVNFGANFSPLLAWKQGK